MMLKKARSLVHAMYNQKSSFARLDTGLCDEKLDRVGEADALSSTLPSREALRVVRSGCLEICGRNQW